jgi:plasmid stabilization system protein ParE
LKATVLLSERFQTNLADIAVELATRTNREYAERVIAQLLEKAESLTRMPRRGRMVPEVEDEAYRELIVVRKQYRLVYRTNEDASIVEVLFVFSAVRGFPYEALLDAE